MFASYCTNCEQSRSKERTWKCANQSEEGKTAAYVQALQSDFANQRDHWVSLERLTCLPLQM